MANLLIRDPFLAAPFRLMDELMRSTGNGGNRVTGFTREARELFKQRLLQVTADDLRRVTGSYLLGAPAVQTTVAGSDLIEAARKERPALFEVVAAI